MTKKKSERQKQGQKKLSKNFGWLRLLLWAVIVLELITIVVLKRSQCMSQCVSDFLGPYPEIACKYECPYVWENWGTFFKK